MVPQQQQYVKSEVKNEVHDGQSVQVVKQQPNTQIIQAPAHLVSAHRVAEILKAAGETFCRLGECTMMLDQTAQPSKTKVCTDFKVLPERKWETWSSFHKVKFPIWD